MKTAEKFLDTVLFTKMSRKKGQSSGSKEPECTAAAVQGCGLVPLAPANVGAEPGSRSPQSLGGTRALPPSSSTLSELRSRAPTLQP